MVLIYIAGISNGIYGLMNMMGGIMQLRQKKIQVWSAWLMIIMGFVIIMSGAVVMRQGQMGVTMLIVGLVAIHLLTLNNGWYMYGKINLRHHLLRLGISILLLVLTVWSYQ